MSLARKPLVRPAPGRSRFVDAEWTALLEISQRVNSSLDVEVVLNQTLEMLTEVVQADASSIWLVDEGARELFCAIATGDKSDEVRKIRLPLGLGIVGWVVQNDTFYQTVEASEDEQHARDVAQKLDYTCHTLLCVPMHSRGRVIGAIEVINKVEGAEFENEDLLQLSIFANLVGLAIENARFYTQAQQENRNLRRELGDRRIEPKEIISESKKMQEVSNLVERVAPTESTVLIRGESGTGKEIIAQTIHALSPRSRGPFVAINCGGIPENLLESELFGHEKGAFTGATTRRVGRFELAKGGTIFLDEIGDMPPQLQVKLLRVLQTRRFERLGGNQLVEADVRIIAATHQDLEELLRDGRFREDLYYRLNVISIFVPSLRERKEDVLPLARHFLKESGMKMHRPARDFHPDTEATLVAHDWPGNVRELENAIEHSLVLATTPEVRPTDLPFNVQTPIKRFGVEAYPDSLEEAQRIFRRNHVKQALERNNGNRTRAAKTLSVQRTYLSRLIKELDLGDDDEDNDE